MSQGFFQRPALEDSLAGKTDFTSTIDIGNHHGDLIAHADDIFHFIQRVAVELGDMHHTILIGQDLDESAKIGDANNLTGIDPPEDRRFGDLFDALACLIGCWAICSGDVNSAIFFDINLDTRLFLDAADDLTTRANDRTDLIDRDLTTMMRGASVLSSLRGSGMISGILSRINRRAT